MAQESKSFNDNTSKNEGLPVTENSVTGEIVYGNPDALTNPETAFAENEAPETNTKSAAASAEVFNSRESEATVASEGRNWILPGILIGGIIGGALALRDSNTREKVVDNAVGLKDTSVDMLTQLKENPKETVNELMDQFRTASSTLQEAMNEALDIYQMVTKQLTELKNPGSITENLSNVSNIVNVAKEAKEKAADAVSKVTEATDAFSVPNTNNQSNNSSY
jgi:gas vesicle protein